MAVAVAVVGLLLLAEPDMGAFMVIATIAMGILFLGGVNARMFFLIAAGAGGGLRLMISFRRPGGASASWPTWTPGTRSTRRARPTS
jgi:cell division protein FtsW (lipid II flippase)